MMHRKLFSGAYNSTLALGLAIVLTGAPAGLAQDGGNWRASSSTAKSVTGDVAFFNQKIALAFSTFTVAQIRTLTLPEATSVFNGAEPGGAGNLYRTSIPSDKRLLHKNTLCGSEETQWIVSYVSGHTLQLAFFSDAKMPVLTPEAMANTSSLCGTYTYVR